MKPILAAALAPLAALSALAPRALRPQPLDRPLAHLQRSHWGARNGLAESGLMEVERSGDGYLWLGSTEGLVRFDGVRFVRMDSTQSRALRATPGVSYSMLDDSHPEPARALSVGLTSPLLADRDGALWVGMPDGRLLRYADGTFEVVLREDPKVGRINELARDGTGRLWAVGSLGARLYTLRDGRLLPPDLPPAVPRVGVTTLLADAGEGLWIGTYRDGLWHVAGREARRHVPPRVATNLNVRPILLAPDGALWVQAGTLMRLLGDRWEPVLPEPGRRVTAVSAVALPGGGVVAATRGYGLLRWKDGAVDWLGERDGLSSESAHQLLFDAEGSLWISTDAGLDRLRAAPFATISATNGLPFSAPAALLFGGDGVLWASNAMSTNVLHALDPERLLAGRPPAVARLETPPTSGFYTPLAAPAGRGGDVLLLHNRGGLAVYGRGRGAPLAIRGLPARARVRSGTAARDGAVWVTLAPHGVGRVRDGGYTPVALAGLERRRASAVAEDASGRAWVAFADTAVALALVGDHAVVRLDAARGLREPLSLLVAGHGDTLWGAGATTGALVRIAGGRATALESPPLARLFRGSAPVIVPSGGTLWIASTAGIASLPTAAFAAAGAGRALTPRFYTALEGLTVAKLARTLLGGAAVDRAGRIWFSTAGGLAVVDPAALEPNRVAPRVHVEEVHVAGRPVALPRGHGRAVVIPPNPDRLDIRFTATALLVPERARIQYRLSGVDGGWVDGSLARTASYTQLRPGRYEFRVRAWNEDGVPSAGEASLAFQVLPAWYQTVWSLVLGAVALVAVGSGGAHAWQRARARRREERLRARFDATLEERTRVARELHDTLLSGLTGITLQLQAVRDTARAAPDRTAERLSRILESADETLREARRTIWDMRAPPLEAPALVAALERAAREAVADTPTQVQLVVRGEPARLAAAAEETLRRVGQEAVINAARHAGARVVRLELDYRRDCVALTVSDDGRGLGPDAIDAAVASGHWGIRGMRERTERAGGVLEIRSAAERGTTVSVSLPNEEPR